MIVLFFIGFVLLALVALPLILISPRSAAIIAGVFGSLLLFGILIYTANSCPWIFVGGDSNPYKFMCGCIAAVTIVTVVIVFLSIKCLGKNFGPTSGSLEELNQEVDQLVRLQNRQALIMALVPRDAIDPATGKQATLRQLCDYRWCACWLAYNQRMKAIDDPARWPVR